MKTTRKATLQDMPQLLNCLINTGYFIIKNRIFLLQNGF